MNTTKVPLGFIEEEYIHPSPGGHSACPGCAVILALRYFLRGLGGEVLFVTMPGCGIVMLRPFIGGSISECTSPFGLAATHAGGLKTALKLRGDTETQVVALAGDGATFDLGLACVSGAAERNEDIIVPKRWSN